MRARPTWGYKPCYRLSDPLGSGRKGLNRRLRCKCRENERGAALSQGRRCRRKCRKVMHGLRDLLRCKGAALDNPQARERHERRCRAASEKRGLSFITIAKDGHDIRDAYRRSGAPLYDTLA